MAGAGLATGSGSGSGGGSTIPKRGTFKVRVYKPTGDCASNSSWGQGSAFNGTLNAELYKADGTFQRLSKLLGNYGPSNSSSSYLLGLYDQQFGGEAKLGPVSQQIILAYALFSRKLYHRL